MLLYCCLGHEESHHDEFLFYVLLLLLLSFAFYIDYRLDDLPTALSPFGRCLLLLIVATTGHLFNSSYQ